MARLNYIELPVGNAAASRDFYSAAFGWAFTDYGPDYAAYEGGDTDLGLNGTAGDRTATILPVIEVQDIEAARADVIAAGGTISRDIFAFPGGRRFHFSDPDGLELGVYIKE